MNRVNIEAERGRLQMTKAYICKVLGITQKTYNSYVKGASIPSDTLEAMADLFHCTTDYLLGRETA